MKRDIDEKAEEIVRGLARRTGVDAGSVRNILSHLGLESALHHRSYADWMSGTKTLKNVSADTVRLTTIPRMI